MQPPSVDPTVILNGGVDVVARLFAGEPKTVKVRLLRLRELDTLLSLAGDYEGLAEFVTGEAAGWSAGVVPDSILEIAEVALELNFASARRLAELRVKHGGLAAAFKNPPSLAPLPGASAKSPSTPPS